MIDALFLQQRVLDRYPPLIVSSSIWENDEAHNGFKYRRFLEGFKKSQSEGTNNYEYAHKITVNM